jgi:hypothetical protein
MAAREPITGPAAEGDKRSVPRFLDQFKTCVDLSKNALASPAVGQGRERYRARRRSGTQRGSMDSRTPSLSTTWW